MSPHSTYETLRHLADSWGLIGMGLLFLALVAWPFRPSARGRNHTAATTIFEDDEP
jgi:cytochrome c oxidase cbb3-type subunit 4